MEEITRSPPPHRSPMLDHLWEAREEEKRPHRCRGRRGRRELAGVNAAAEGGEVLCSAVQCYAVLHPHSTCNDVVVRREDRWPPKVWRALLPDTPRIPSSAHLLSFTSLAPQPRTRRCTPMLALHHAASKSLEQSTEAHLLTPNSASSHLPLPACVRLSLGAVGRRTLYGWSAHSHLLSNARLWTAARSLQRQASRSPS